MTRKLIFIALIILLLVVILMVLFRTKKIPPSKAPSLDKIAIVIDDWGYNFIDVAWLDKIEAPLTISVLPNLKYSAEVAEWAEKRGHEVILHLPLEPEEKSLGPYRRLEARTITISMSKDEVIDNFRKAVSSVPHLKGVSNHMGSKATQNKELMKIIFKEMSKESLYFLDNLVTDKSVCQDLSRQINIRFAQRDVFLDNFSEAQYIKGQFEELKKVAKKKGYAVGIAHDRKATLVVIKEIVSQFKKEGIRFVHLSELVK